ncbi:eukaryotic translation initiation factor 4E class II [Athelia psychrophila]|uniref:Eukaryotic translation initiation factor 4E class II n=1 Tax=Athelia psychrophila TaxID=1759441 RepID=A0A166BMN0_9AGAM|nr:eukaryotic translation initiation factor 4E class II [Fibularhizoctonia sp. CBS 109695]
MSTPPSASVAVPQPQRPLQAGRMPSLNQLAARININNTNPTASGTTSSTAGRPRLAASLLRTGAGSSTSVSTVASTADSLVVNAPSTRSGSPATVGTASPPPQSQTPTIPEDSTSDPLTSEKLERLNQETAPERKTKVGYKNIPSLDAITQRLAKARSLSIDGSSKPPEAQMIEDPQTPGASMKAPEHPLQFPWTIYHDCKTKIPFTPAPVVVATEAAPFSAVDTGDYEAGLTVIGEFETVETFCRYFNWLKLPSKLERNSNYHLFKSGIKPMWEDEANANGGKWVLTMKNNPALLDRCWSWLAMALVGEELEDGDDICGAVVSLRSKVDRIQVWTRNKDDIERLNGIGKRFVKLLDISEADGIGLEFQYNSDDRPPPNKFLSIQSMPQSSFRSSFAGAHPMSRSVSQGGSGPVTPGGVEGAPMSAGPTAGGAFGAFGAGGVGGGSWKGVKRT